MSLDLVSSYADDQFVFKQVPDGIDALQPTNAIAALSAALTARDIDPASLTSSQMSVLADFAEDLEVARTSNVTTAEDAAALFNDTLDVIVVDDLKTLDGAKLNGAATSDGRILLDAALKGEALTDTLVEEVSEAAFYAIFNTVSQGDFGAEVQARLSGVTSPDELARFTQVSEEDTVLTEFGEAQANRPAPAALTNGLAADYKAANAGHTVTGIFTYDGGNTPTAEDFTSFKPVVDFDLRGLNLSSINGKYDANNDGVPDQYALRHVNTDFNSPSLDGGNALYIISATPTEIIPTSQSAQVLIGRGEASTTWVLRTQETHSTAREFNWNVSLAKEVGASINLGAVDLSGSVTTTIEGGGSTTRTNTFTVGNEVRDTYTIPAEAYKEGTLVSYGFHMLTGDVDLVESYGVYAAITNAREGYDDHLFLRGAVRGQVDDHYLGIVMTDFDMANVPNAADLFDIA